jgi:MFS transporter, DHA1 family, chloramphenicol resistance protein
VTTTLAPTPPRTRLPLSVYVLALTVFCLGTSEFMLAGLLPPIASDLDVSIPQAGLLISGFALGMLFGAPVMAMVTLRLPRKVTLIGAATVFAAAHVLSATAGSFGVLMLSRVVAAVACATFWAVAAVTVVSVVAPSATARGMAVLLGGLSLANIAGVPLGTWVGEHVGWRGAFLAIGALTVVATLATLWKVPETSDRSHSRTTREVLRAEVAGLRGRRLWVALGTTAAFQAAVFGTFSYLAPLLTDVSGLSTGVVPLVLLVFGVGSFLGLNVGARFADRSLLGNIAVSLVLTAAALGLLVLISGTVAVVAAVFLFGATAFSMASALNARVFLFAGAAPTLASAVNVSAFNLGNTAGPWFGGEAIDVTGSYLAPAVVSGGLVAVALGLTGWSRLLERRARRDEPAPAAPATAAVPAGDCVGCTA